MQPEKVEPSRAQEMCIQVPYSSQTDSLFSPYTKLCFSLIDTRVFWSNLGVVCVCDRRLTSRLQQHSNMAFMLLLEERIVGVY
jgi:hypothetical protein